MKIKFPDTAASAVMTLCGQGRDEGSFAGTIPVTLNLASNVTVQSEKLLKVTSSTSVNKRGVRSGVIKVSLPYEALIANGNGGYVADPTRSGSELSVHVVVAIPAAAASDIRSSDTVAQENAKAQIGAAAFLLSCLAQGLLSTPLTATDSNDATHVGTWSPTAVRLDENADYVNRGSDFGIRALPLGFAPTAEGYQQNGGLTFARGGIGFAAAAGKLLERIARSMPAIDGCSDVDVVYYDGSAIAGE